MSTPPPIIHADLPMEELAPPAFAGQWKNPVNDEKLRIRKIGRLVYFTGMLVCGSTVSMNVFASPLPEGWRPSGSQWFNLASQKGNCLFAIWPNGELQCIYGQDNAKSAWVPVNGIYYFAEN